MTPDSPRAWHEAPPTPPQREPHAPVQPGHRSGPVGKLLAGLAMAVLLALVLLVTLAFVRIAKFPWLAG